MMKHLPRRVSRRVVYRGRVFRVEQDRIALPDGRTVVQDIVRHARSVVLLPQPSRFEIILIRQYRHAIGRWIWELPAGSLDAGERPRSAARRECEEEVGLTPRRIERLVTAYPTPGFCDEEMIFYRCTDLVRPRRPRARDPDELLEARVFTMAQARRLVDARRVRDMKTAMGLSLV